MNIRYALALAVTGATCLAAGTLAGDAWSHWRGAQKEVKAVPGAAAHPQIARLAEVPPPRVENPVTLPGGPAQGVGVVSVLDTKPQTSIVPPGKQLDARLASASTARALPTAAKDTSTYRVQFIRKGVETTVYFGSPPTRPSDSKDTSTQTLAQ